ncbi:uncharacterized protein LOC107046160 [Diachasma alloeum]|uniref:uncharacterized protein LOC107046160 n=1 Tax=Diachasma alloeum TaxID=454923 RepID=UPI000738381B|nr:uncharacterized protein LOC107046160 [Diachasma alloeum]
MYLPGYGPKSPMSTTAVIEYRSRNINKDLGNTEARATNDESVEPNGNKTVKTVSVDIQLAELKSMVEKLCNSNITSTKALYESLTENRNQLKLNAEARAQDTKEVQELLSALDKKHNDKIEEVKRTFNEYRNNVESSIKHKGPRCFACQAYGHKGPDCPNKGKGYLCYKCNQFGNHKARDCPNITNNDNAPSGPGYSKQTPRYNSNFKFNYRNNYQDQYRGNGRGMKRPMRGETYGPIQRGRFNKRRFSYKRRFLSEGKKSPFSTPAVRSEPRDHIGDCFFPPSVVLPMLITSSSVTADESPVEVNVEQDPEEPVKNELDEEYEPVPNVSASNAPSPFNPDELDDLIKDLKLSKEEADTSTY